MPDVQLKVGPKLYSGWTAMRRQGSLERAAGAFALQLTERWPGQPRRWAIEPGAACELRLDGQTVITGHVDKVERTLDAEQHQITVTGRDAAGDLVDSSALLPGDKIGSLRQVTLAQAINILAGPFGVRAIDKANASKRIEVSIDAPETVWDTVERYARQLAVYVTSDGRGHLLITRAGTTTHPARLVQGENILSARFVRDDSGRYHRYIARNQNPTNGTLEMTPEQVSQQEARAADVGARSPRVRLLGEGANTDGVALQQRVDWERNHRRGLSRRLIITVPGWSAQGRLWQPNEMAHVEIPLWGIKGELLIVAVDQSLDEQGTRTELTLAPREAYDLLPVAAKPAATDNGEWAITESLEAFE